MLLSAVYRESSCGLETVPGMSEHARRNNMKTEIEKELAAELLRNRHDGRQTLYARAIINSMVLRGTIQNEKQAHRTLEKWTGKDWYDYGVCLDLGWLTPKGVEHFRSRT